MPNSALVPLSFGIRDTRKNTSRFVLMAVLTQRASEAITRNRARRCRTKAKKVSQLAFCQEAQLALSWQVPVLSTGGRRKR